MQDGARTELFERLGQLRPRVLDLVHLVDEDDRKVLVRVVCDAVAGRVEAHDHCQAGMLSAAALGLHASLVEQTD